jgi:hypothetical protein
MADMPRDGSIASRDLIGKLDMLRVECAMYGRRPRCKRNLTYPRSVRVQSCIRPVFAWRVTSNRDAAAMAAGPDVIR